MPTNIKESGLETLIVNYLCESNSYEQGTNEDYNKDHAIDEKRLIRFWKQHSQMSLKCWGLEKVTKSMHNF